MNSENGYVRWWHLATAFIGLLGIFTTVALAFGNYAISNDCRIEDKVEDTTKCLYRIDTRLARIEERLGIENRAVR